MFQKLLIWYNSKAKELLTDCLHNSEMLQTTLTNPNDNDMEKLGRAFALHSLVYI